MSQMTRSKTRARSNDKRFTSSSIKGKTKNTTWMKSQQKKITGVKPKICPWERYIFPIINYKLKYNKLRVF